jgi:hypothetical protein
VKPSGVIKVTYSGASAGQYLGLLKGSMISPGEQLTKSSGETFFSVSSFSSGTTVQLILYDFSAQAVGFRYVPPYRAVGRFLVV